MNAFFTFAGAHPVVFLMALVIVGITIESIFTAIAQIGKK